MKKVISNSLIQNILISYPQYLSLYLNLARVVQAIFAYSKDIKKQFVKWKMYKHYPSNQCFQISKITTYFICLSASDSELSVTSVGMCESDSFRLCPRTLPSLMSSSNLSSIMNWFVKPSIAVLQSWWNRKSTVH